ncbi:MAG TPA: prephenate dehydratase [Candidatus Paceibacterota bacterium]|nr:prephenate dehydratase [Verrucomicrobiota bacterium]HOX01075.1 prephenate dehydratase [Verrucomicrobiota bacterium]HRZ43821.1 prephenate dehydratase [Candidatus Paceibacterota bacterium]HRZ92625.1 prephenate dehydratase [Candidatus Paceibacterota bacterium]
MNITQLRKAIDRLDSRIVELLNERTRHVLRIREAKLATGGEVYAPHRELSVFERVTRLNRGPITEEGLRAIYREIMSSALALQKSMTIAYLGPEATFTHQAAVQRFGSSLRYSAQKSIADIFAEVSRQRADYGVVPVENSTEGVVTHTLDMFVDSDLKVVSQIVMPIRQCLLSRSRRGRIQRLYSHPQALAQCRGYVQKNLSHLEIIETSSTTRAAELAGAHADAAAIASAMAAQCYRLEIIETGIQDSSENATRFLVLGRECSPPTGKDRTSLMLSIADKVGALHAVLASFRRYRINMTKIESRPSKRKAWEYFFFIDCDGHFQDRRLAKAIADLEPQCNFVKILGSYPNAE